MSKRFLAALFTLLPALMAPALASPADRSTTSGLWRALDADAVARLPRQAAASSPNPRVLALDRDALQAQLAGIALERDVAVQSSPATIELPLPDATFARFRLVEAPIMEPALARKYPQIKTYLGQGIDDATATLRLDVTPSGLHAQILSVEGSVYIDPYAEGDTDHYRVVSDTDAAPSRPGAQCRVIGAPEDAIAAAIGTAPSPQVSNAGTLRTYRLAVAATGEYTAVFGGTVPAAFNAIVTTINRVNGIYERELGVRLVLVANEDSLIFTNATTDPYNNSSPSSLLTANQTTLDMVIGTANYDIGHVFSTGGGGSAQQGSVCQAASKARGESGVATPYGDRFDIDYIAHEMAHQFNAAHTFNGTVSACAERSASSAYETGSGISLMSYAGLCGSENLGPHAEDFFHRASLTAIITFITSGGGSACGTTTPVSNAAPVVAAATSVTIPAQTPFTLTASASDSDGDALTYAWEEFDLGTSTSGTLSDNGSRPLLRPFPPSASPSRTFPSLRFILDNANTVPAAAPLPGTTAPTYATGELLPSLSRTMNFRVTARDNHAGGGGTGEASSAVVIAASAGPFVITSPNTAVTWAAGSTNSVTWNVANTATTPISVANVKISLSLDGGYTFPIVLAASTLNSGSANVMLPSSTPPTAQARIKVEALGNIFFDISNANFAITRADNSAPPGIAVIAALATTQGAPATTADVATISDSQTPAGSLGVSVSGAPPELIVSAANNAGTVALTASAACSLTAPSPDTPYPVRLTVTDSGGGTASAMVNVTVGPNSPPDSIAYASATVPRGAVTSITPTTTPGDPDGNYPGTATVTPTSLAGGTTLAIAANGVITVTTTSSSALATSTVRVTIADSCGAVRRATFSLTVSDVIFANGFE